jgi:hypothetical protein
MEIVFLGLMIFSLMVIITIDSIQKRHKFLVEGK